MTGNIKGREVRINDRLEVKEWESRHVYLVVRVQQDVLVCKRLTGFRQGEHVNFDRARILAPTDYY